MKKLIALTFMAVLFIASCKEDDIGDIMSVYNLTNKEMPTYTHKTVDMTGTTKTGGTVNGYYKGKDLRKATLEFFFDTGRTYSEFYFDDGELVMMVQQKFHYNRPYYYDEDRARANNDTEWYDDSKSEKMMTRCYFKDGDMIKWVDDNKLNRLPDTKEFANQQKQVIADAESIKKMLNEAQ